MERKKAYERDKMYIALGRARVSLIGTMLLAAIGTTLTTLFCCGTFEKLSEPIMATLGILTGVVDASAIGLGMHTDNLYRKFSDRKIRYDRLP